MALARVDGRRAREQAERALGLARAAGDHEAASTALRALGLAAREAGDVGGSVALLRRAVRTATARGHHEAAARARMSLAGSLAVRGEWAAALRHVDRASAGLTGADLARLRVQRATVLTGQGRLDDAIAGYSEALPQLMRAGDSTWTAQLLANRGLARLQRGELGGAADDLGRADRLFRELGQPVAVARALQGLGLVASRCGNLPEALARFDEAATWLRRCDAPQPMMLHDRCEALLAARLVKESRRCAEEAVRVLTAEGRHGYAATARLKLAEAALADGDTDAARSAAVEAARVLSGQRRAPVAALARYVAQRAAWEGGERTTGLLAACRRNADALERAGFAIHALDARLLAARLALDLGRNTVARTELARAGRARRRAPVQIRSRAWHAEALLRLSTGDRRGAQAALRAGMRAVDSHRIALGATELRVNAGGHVVELAGLGVDLALEAADARRALAWAERGRAGSTLLRPARPPGDARLARDLGALRATVAEIEARARDGRPTAGLVARQARLEEAVRDRARCATGVLAAATAPVPPVETLVAALGPAVLFELVEHDGVVHGLRAHDGRVSIHRLGGIGEAVAELDHLRFSLRRLAFPMSDSRRSGLIEAADHSAAALEGLVMGDVDLGPASAPLVVVPTGSLHAVPWSALPRLRCRPVTIAPSLAAWHRAGTARRHAGGPAVFIAGPGLDHAVGEARSLARRSSGARCLVGPEATCRSALAALDGAALAHVAAHGRFRADNPLFSSLELADGPLTVYDLEGLAEAPHIVVLAACDVGRAEVRPGDELMGLAAALLALGSRTLVASVFPVADRATTELMSAFHAGVRRGLAPAAAMAAARRAGAKAGDWTVGAAFACLGAG